MQRLVAVVQKKVETFLVNSSIHFSNLLHLYLPKTPAQFSENRDFAHCCPVSLKQILISFPV